jgi:8-oxo-dGTP pyrophosphatase MutT (NUDIX family)
MSKVDGATVFLFSKDKKKIVLVKRRDIPAWVIPGGGIEEGETAEVAAIRECKEETGFEVKFVRKVAEYTHVGSLKKNHLFEAIIIGGKATLNPEAKAIEFFDPKSLPFPCHPQIPTWFADLEKNSKKVIKKDIQGITNRQMLRQFYKHPMLVIRFFLIRMGIHINT